MRLHYLVLPILGEHEVRGTELVQILDSRCCMAAKILYVPNGVTIVPPLLGSLAAKRDFVVYVKYGRLRSSHHKHLRRKRARP